MWSKSEWYSPLDWTHLLHQKITWDHPVINISGLSGAWASQSSYLFWPNCQPSQVEPVIWGQPVSITAPYIHNPQYLMKSLYRVREMMFQPIESCQLYKILFFHFSFQGWCISWHKILYSWHDLIGWNSISLFHRAPH